VITSLLLQGSTIAWSARQLGVALPDLDDTAEAREVFGDFMIPGDTPLLDLCSFYNLPVPANSDQTAANWLREELHRPPVVGDSATLGPAELSVRAMDGQRITQVGIKLS
jgi:potassium/hydrogen antiporter